MPTPRVLRAFENMQKHGSEEHPRGRPTSSELAELALAVYVEELAVHKRVLFIGEPTSPAPERLGRVARSVDVVSPRSRARGTRRGGRVVSRRWPTEGDAGRWDLVIVPDLPAAGLADEKRVAELSSWLAPGGVLVAGTPDPEGPEGHPSAIAYEALFDLLDGAFEHVRMLGQAPFAGYSVVDFAPTDELDVTFDGSILEGRGEQAERYYALCGERDVVLDAYAVVQVPLSAQAKVWDRGESAARLREQQDALDAANIHAEELERELERARRELADAKAELEEARDRAEAYTAEAQKEQDSLRARVAELEEQLEDARAKLERERAAARDALHEKEFAALEAALEARGQELIELKAEVERRGILARDLIEELREARGWVRTPESTPEPPPPDSDAERGQLQAAVERAVAAETARAELSFQLDEVRGKLALLQQESSNELEALRRVEAELHGTVRGLRARLAELEEQHRLTQARLALLEDDRAAAEARNRRLTRELAEAREKIELGIVRERMASRSESAPVPKAAEEAHAAREGQLLGALRRCREELADRCEAEEVARSEAERARAALRALEAEVEGMRAGYEARVRELVRELDEVTQQAEQALTSAGELRARIATGEQTEAELRGELEGLRLRVADRDAAIAALRGAELSDGGGSEPSEASADRGTEDGEGEAPALRAQIGALEAELQSSREEVSALQKRIEELDVALESSRRASATVQYERDSEARLAASLDARNALVVRLQRELAEAIERRHALERRLDDCAAKLARCREEHEEARAVAEVRDSEFKRELDELAARLERTESERRAALDGLEEARAILTELAEELPRRREATESDSATVHELRERLARMDAEAADREVLLRSLTAQLQERDDRIRALERLPALASNDEPSELRKRLVEMEERVARLTDELEHERAARQRAENRPS